MNQKSLNLAESVDQFAENQDDSSREIFYHALLNHAVWVPLSQEQDLMEEGTMSIQLSMTEEDKLYFPLFSSLERLQKWIAQEHPYTQIPGRQYLELVLKENNLAVLDPAGPNTYEFTLKEISFILNDLEQNL